MVKFLGPAAIFIALLTTGTNTWAQGVRGGASGLKNPNSLNGLCTTHDNGQKWVQQGWCKTIRETLSQGCAQSKFNDVRQKAQSGRFEGVQEYCPNIQELAGDQNHFASFLTNLVATLIIEESDWRERGATSSMGAKGLGQLSVGSARQAAYKCGCNKLTAGTIEKGHENAGCTAYIALHWWSKDSTVGKGSGNKGARGAARYFQPFRDIDKNKRERMKKKMSNYCRQRQGGSIDLQGEGGPAPGTGR